MRENCTSGLMRGSNGNGDSRPLLSTLPVLFPFAFSLFTFSVFSEPCGKPISASQSSAVIQGAR